MNYEANSRETAIQSPQKSLHMAILEDHMRTHLGILEKEARIYEARFIKTGDPLYQRASLGKQTHAEAYQLSIDGAVDEVGEQYELMNAVVQSVVRHTANFVGEHAIKHRPKMEQRLMVVLARYGLIGSKTEIYKHSADELINDRNTILAGVHGEEVRRGAPRVHPKAPYDPLKPTR